jgi:hypothetical protein
MGLEGVANYLSRHEQVFTCNSRVVIAWDGRYTDPRAS